MATRWLHGGFAMAPTTVTEVSTNPLLADLVNPMAEDAPATTSPTSPSFLDGGPFFGDDGLGHNEQADEELA